MRYTFVPHLRRPLVIIPTYNERANVTELLQAILHVDGRLHILIVDDNSPDKTAEAVLDSKKQTISGSHPPAVPARETRSRDRLRLRLQVGPHATDTIFMIEMDGDWSHSPADLATMLRCAEEYDFVVASRYIKGGGTLNWGLGRKSLSKSASVYARIILRWGFCRLHRRIQRLVRPAAAGD